MNKYGVGSLCLIFLLAAPGCLLPAKMKLAPHHKAWIGEDETVLIEHWGTPYRMIEEGDTKILKYRRAEESGTGLDMYIFHVNSEGIIEDITINRIWHGFEISHWP